MRIDTIGAASQAFGISAEAVRSTPVAAQAQSDTVNLSALASGEDEQVTSHTAGLITGNAAGALAAHGRLDPERAMRLVGLLD